ncbi:MAG: alkaline phosphatase family protein [bacterium]
MGRSPHGRIFVVGLDGATYDLIDPWVSEGRLPTFARLLENGVRGQLQSVVPPLTTPAWVSFQTGKRPASHGVFSWVRRVGTCAFEPFDRTRIFGDTLPVLLSRHGLKVGMVNVPCTYPPQPVNGFIVTGLETPSRASAFTYPAELRTELLSRFDYEVERTQKYRRGLENGFVEAVENVEKKRGEAVLCLMKERDWDLFMVVFRGTDILSHAFWRCQDPGHPAYRARAAAAYGKVLLDHYRLMDDMIRRIWEKLDRNDTLLLMSDHGSCGYWRHVFLDNLFLERGLLHFRNDWRISLRRGLFRLGLTPSNLMGLLSRARLRNLIRKLVPQDLRIRANHRVSLGSAIDWSRSAAFPFGGVGQVYVNLKGREEQGCVDPADFEAVVQRIIGAVRELTEPLTGEPMVARVLRKEELGADLMNPLVPDLYIEWHRDRYGDFGGIGIHNDLMTDIQVEFSGAHSMRGLFLALGPAFPRGAAIEGARLIDLLPTLLHLLDLPIPADLDGRVLEKAYLPGILKERPLRYEEPKAATAGSEHVFTLDEKALVEDRLRSLGYIS